ncbi:MAG: ClbS/DfsB family four-helix bundle protein [Anaerolineae bacterium]
MEEITSKTELMTRVQTSWARWKAVLAPVPMGRYLKPGVEADWTLKDIVAHIAGWENLMADWLEAVMRDETPVGWPNSNEAVDDINARLYAENKDKLLADVMVMAARAHERAVSAVTAVPEANLFAKDKYAWREGLPLWGLVGGNMFWHYEEHMEAVQAWLGE